MHKNSANIIQTRQCAPTQLATSGCAIANEGVLSPWTECPINAVAPQCICLFMYPNVRCSRLRHTQWASWLSPISLGKTSLGPATAPQIIHDFISQHHFSLTYVYAHRLLLPIPTQLHWIRCIGNAVVATFATTSQTAVKATAGGRRRSAGVCCFDVFFRSRRHDTLFIFGLCASSRMSLMDCTFLRVGVKWERNVADGIVMWCQCKQWCVWASKKCKIFSIYKN